MKGRAPRAVAIALVSVAALACRRPQGARPAAATPAALSLPEVLDGYAASPLVTGPGFVRRTYARGPTLLDVTLARAPLGPDGFDGWVKMSQAFPQATLDAPSADANGFYQCTERAAPSCNLLVQLRSGVHVEIRGGGTSTRADVDAIARALPLRALAAP